MFGQQLHLAPGADPQVFVADDGNVVGPVALGRQARQLGHHQGLAAARGSRQHVDTMPGDCGGFPLQSLFQLVAHSGQRFALIAHVFHGIEQQGAQRSRHAGLGKGIHQGLDFRCQVQAALPAGGFLAEVELAAQAGQLVTDQIHDFPAPHHVALLHFAGAFGKLHVKALGCSQHAGALG